MPVIPVLYPEERQIPDDGLEARDLRAEVRLMRRQAKTLADLDPADCAEVDGLMIMRYAVTAEDIDRFPRLRAIVRMGVGYDKIARPAAAARNILVCNVPDYGTTEVADHAMALALSLRRGVILLSRAAAAEPAGAVGAGQGRADPAPRGADLRHRRARPDRHGGGAAGHGLRLPGDVLRSAPAERRRAGARHRPRRRASRICCARPTRCRFTRR